ncbi:telomeric repeat binding factor a isoform X2 [Amia ocellicauda]|uniref:telomeric repeat binding factor a isoform X2 n=1 Tax=Amia ocellicauda TaxID=2972642 RepID=UPI003464D4E2
MAEIANRQDAGSQNKTSDRQTCTQEPWRQSDLESVVTRWVVDYYVHCALGAFRDGLYKDFCEIRDVLQSYVFDVDGALTPLESALRLLGCIGEEVEIPQKDLERVHKSVREMAVTVCIKQKEYEKASRILTRHFPKGVNAKKALFMGLVDQKSSVHSALEQVTYGEFCLEMFKFAEGLLVDSEPFLHKTAEKILTLRCTLEDCSAKPSREKGRFSDGPERTVTPVTRDPPWTTFSRSVLAVAYAAKAEELGISVMFEELEQTDLDPPPPDQRPVSLHLSPCRKLGSPAGKGPHSAHPRQKPHAEEVPESSSNSGILGPVSSADETAHTPGDSGPARAAPHVEEGSVMRESPQAPQSSDSPREGSRTDSPASRKCAVITVARLIMEEDSTQTGEESSGSQPEPMSPPSHHSLPTRRRRNRLLSPQKRALVDSSQDSSDDSDEAVEKHIFAGGQREGQSSRKRRRILDVKEEEKDCWEEEDYLFSRDANGATSDGESVISRSSKKRWTVEESEWIKDGVLKYGEGNWKSIQKNFPFVGRTTVNIKDRWRTMKRLKMV